LATTTTVHAPVTSFQIRAIIVTPSMARKTPTSFEPDFPVDAPVSFPLIGIPIGKAKSKVRAPKLFPVKEAA
jgi:hypothetical protein